jgi:hypothetical protein
MKAILLLVAFFCVAAWSQEPDPSRGKEIHHPKAQAAKAKPEAGNDHRGTEAAPLVIKGFPPSPQSPEEAARNAKERDEKASNERALTLYTGALALITLGLLAVAAVQAGLFLWQLTLMKQSTADSAKLAEAAALQARAAIGIELPIIRAAPVSLLKLDEPMPENGPFGGAVNDGIPTRHSAAGYFKFRNMGRTPAYPEHFAIGWKVANVLPEPPLYIREAQLSHSEVIVADGEKPYRPDPLDHIAIELSDAEVATLNNGTASLWLYGALKYSDFLENTVTTFRFCWKWNDINVGQHNPMYAFTSDGHPPRCYVQKTVEKRL